MIILFWISPLVFALYLLYDKYNPQLFNDTPMTPQQRSDILAQIQQTSQQQGGASEYTDWHLSSGAPLSTQATQDHPEESPSSSRQSQEQPLLPREDNRTENSSSVPSASRVAREYSVNMYYINDNTALQEYELIYQSRDFIADEEAIIPEIISQLLDGSLYLNGGENYISAIPSGTEFLGYQLQDQHLVLDFNDSFLYGLGISGTRLQISQIVLTMLSLPHIQSVSFMIDGSPTDYLDIHGAVENNIFTRSNVFTKLAY